MAGATLYSATMGAVPSMVRTLARELEPPRIRANTISPGPIETPFFVRLDLPAELEKNMAATNPSGRMGTMENVAAVAAFPLSSEAGFVTGSDNAVDGGEAQL